MVESKEKIRTMIETIKKHTPFIGIAVVAGVLFSFVFRVLIVKVTGSPAITENFFVQLLSFCLMGGVIGGVIVVLNKLLSPENKENTIRRAKVFGKYASLVVFALFVGNVCGSIVNIVFVITKLSGFLLVKILIGIVKLACAIVMYKFSQHLLKSEYKKTFVQVVAFVLILLFGVGVLKGLTSLKKPPAKKERVVVVPLLNAIEIETQDIQMVVEGFGTAQPKVQVQIIPQVSGKIVACHPDFVNGGFFEAGESLVKIDPRDYELAVESAESAVARSEVLVEREESEGAIAAVEWAQLNEGEKPSSALVLRKPQIRQAKAELKASQAQLETAKLNLNRTDVSVPFNGRISQESVDIGQYIMAGQSIATVYGTDVVEIVIPLEDKEMAWFDVPVRNNGNKTGSAVVVTAEFAGKEHQWQGRVVRTEGTIDQSSRMVNVVVEVADPFVLSNGRPPLVPGMFTDVKIQGKKLTGVFRVPRYVVHNNDEIWVVREGKLNIEKVEIIRMDVKYAYIGSGLEDGDVIITSSLDTVTDNMNVRVNIIETD